jgi:two-component system response regulator DevR
MLEGTEQSAAGSIIRVYLLDDHEIARRGVKDLLEAEGDIQVVGESGLAEEAIRRILAIRPDVAILDARLPDGSGIDVCRTVRSQHPDLRALILTSYDDDEALFAAIMAGAAGQSTLDPAVTSAVLERLRSGPPADPAVARLTGQERRILEHIGQGLTNRQIAQELGLAEKTVKNYVSSLLAKLGLGSRTQAALFSSKLRGR